MKICLPTAESSIISWFRHMSSQMAALGQATKPSPESAIVNSIWFIHLKLFHIYLIQFKVTEKTYPFPISETILSRNAFGSYHQPYPRSHFLLRDRSSLVWGRGRRWMDPGSLLTPLGQYFSQVARKRHIHAELWEREVFLKGIWSCCHTRGLGTERKHISPLKMEEYD